MEERLPNMDRWGYHAHGRYLLDLERHYLEQILPQFFGYHLLQVGGPITEPYLEASLINHHIYLDPTSRKGFSGSEVHSNLYYLPFHSSSLDVVVLPHVLENIQRPVEFLTAVYDALIAEGHIVVIGFNPISLWGLAKHLRSEDLLWRHAKMQTAGKVKQWLHTVGFEVIQQQRMGYCWPALTQSVMHKTLFLEPLGHACWRMCGAVYMIVARKRVVTPIAIIDEPIKKAVPVRSVEPTSL